MCHLDDTFCAIIFKCSSSTKHAHKNVKLGKRKLKAFSNLSKLPSLYGVVRVCVKMKYIPFLARIKVRFNGFKDLSYLNSKIYRFLKGVLIYIRYMCNRNTYSQGLSANKCFFDR